MDGRAYLLKGGDTGLSAIVPGDPSASYLIEVIKSNDPDIGMPPKGGKLFDDEVELLEQWIAEGAFWPGQMEDKVEKVPTIGHFRRFNAQKSQLLHPIQLILSLNSV